MSVSRHRSDVNSTRQPKTTLALFHHSPPQNSHCASRLSRSALGDWEQHDARRLISVLPRLGYRVGGREPASVNGQRLLLQLPRTVQKHGGNLRSKSCYCEHGADCVQTMPAITQRGPVCRNRIRARCTHAGVDWTDEPPHTNSIPRRQSEQAKQRANIVFRPRAKKATAKLERNAPISMAPIFFPHPR